ncbi:MAG: hypothetical protein IKK52_03590 [Alphaproteobacteria bacterium]|nr:hypothetical protein [Alphaproteobacteria bacterium]
MNSPLMMLSLIVIIPFLGMLFVLTAKDDAENNRRNSSDVAVFSILANIIMIWQIFAFVKKAGTKLHLIETISWLKLPEINFVLAADNMSLLLILAVHIIILAGIVFVRMEDIKQKAMMALSLLFLSMITGLFISNDIFSFFIFFEGMLLPLYMLIGMHGALKKQSLLKGFFVYNFIGCIIFLFGILWLYKSYGAFTPEQFAHLSYKKKYVVMIWAMFMSAFMFRIPIWPFHYFIATINTKIRNPLVFLEVSLLPLSGLYGLYRFWPNYIPLEISQHFVWINVIGILTMLFISLIGFSNSDSQYRIFAYSTIYYIMYLLGIFSQNKGIYANLNYALFGFLLVLGGLEVVSSYIRRQEQLFSSTSQGFLCRAHRLSLVYSFLVFSAVGFPVSSMFTNNFLILSQFLSVNIHMGSVLVLSWMLVSVSLIIEMLRLKTDAKECLFGKSEDLPKSYFIFMLFIIFMLLMSFIHPLWFVINT